MNTGKYFCILISFFISCGRDYDEISGFSDNGNINAIIEIPAGTNRKIELNQETGQLEEDLRSGKDRIVKFLPYPVNYGFVASTNMRKDQGGDGDPLDVLLIAEAVPSGTVIEVIPVGLLKMKDNGELDHKVLAIPASPDLQILKLSDLPQIRNKYPAILSILELWFDNYDEQDDIRILGWGDRREAIREIRRWTIR